MPPVEFNPDLPVVVAKEFPGAGGKMLKVGAAFDWEKLKVKPERVAAMVRTRLLKHPDQPVSRAAAKQAQRLAEDKKIAKRGHAPVSASSGKRGKKVDATALQAPKPLTRLPRTRTPLNRQDVADDDDED